eukprot:4755759-Prymnesium_polylepis.1
MLRLQAMYSAHAISTCRPGRSAVMDIPATQLLAELRAGPCATAPLPVVAFEVLCAGAATQQPGRRIPRRGVYTWRYRTVGGVNTQTRKS